MYKKVFNVVSKILGIPIESLNENSSQESVEYWDSLKHMSLILAIEEEFNVLFSDEEITKVGTIKNIVELLSEKGVPFDKT